MKSRPNRVYEAFSQAATQITSFELFDRVLEGAIWAGFTYNLATLIQLHSHMQPETFPCKTLPVFSSTGHGYSQQVALFLVFRIESRVTSRITAA